MSTPDNDTEDTTTARDFRSSQVKTDSIFREGKAVYSNITVGGRIVQKEEPEKNEPPPISYWRQAKLTDIPRIQRLVTDYSIQAFGEVNLQRLIEGSLVSLVQINEEDEIILFFAFSKRSQLPAIPKSATTDFLELYYGLPFLKLPGMYMARIVLWDDRYTGDTLRYVLRSLFSSQQEVSFVILILPGQVPVDDFIKTVFIQRNAVGVKNAENLQTIHLCHRESVLGKINTRIAQGPEGIRDASKIFDYYAGFIQQKFGYFSLKELIENLESRIVLYSEIRYRGKTRPAALTVLNMEVNLELINSHFKTLPFYGFKKPHPKDIIRISGWEESTVSPAQSLKSLDDDNNEEQNENMEEVKESRWAREARIAAEKIERRRRRLSFADHYLSELSLTEDERNEPNDPFHVADDPWDQIVDEDPHDEPTVTTKIKRVRKKGKNPRLAQKKDVEIQDYRGASNAFIVELILTHPNHGDRLGSWYLTALFDQYPDLDYCLLATPRSYPDFPLLRYFTRLTPRPGKNFAQDIHILHRSAVIGLPAVRNGTPNDLPVLKHMVRTLQRGKAAMLNELRHAFSPNAPSWLRPFVFTVGEKIVGAAVIAEEDDLPSLLAHYDINRYINAYMFDREDVHCLRVGLMSPIYQKFGPFYLREIMRHMDSGMLFHPVFPFTEEMLSKNDKIPDGPELCPTQLLMEMVPIMPRPYQDVVFDKCPNLAGDSPEVLRAAMKRITPCSLFISTPRFTAMVKRVINLQIVIIGASESSMSFLQNLIFSETCDTTRYTHLTLIAKAPLPHWVPSPLIDVFRPFVGLYSRLLISKLGLPIWVNIVVGSVQTIDRKKRLVTTTDEAVIPYNMLFLFPGEQFSQPYLYRDMTVDRCRHYVFQTPGVVSEETPGTTETDDDEQPINAFYINAEADIIDALTKLARGIRLTAKYTIIVYGHKLELYTCLSGLLAWGVPGENIVVILDRIYTKEDNVFADEEVMWAIEKSMLDEGIVLYIGWTMRSWQIDDLDQLSTRTEPHVINVTFWPQPGAIVKRKVKTEVEDAMASGPLTFNCMGIFHFSHKTIDKNLLNAIFEAGLVFDGRLVVDRNGSTNDPRIKAAGPITRLSRRIPHAKDATLYSSIEHGYRLAQRMRHIWDPVERDHVYIRSIISRSSDTEDLTSNLRNPISRIEPSHRTKMANAINAALGPFAKYSSVHTSLVYPNHVSCALPGGWYFYSTSRPGKTSRRKNIEYRSGECEEGKGPYCRITFGPGNLLSCIWILSETPQPRRTLSALYGHHIDTLGPFEDSKNLLRTLLRPEVVAQTVQRRSSTESMRDLELLHSFPCRVLLTTTEMVLKNNSWKELSRAQIMELRRQFLNSPQQKRLEDRLETYLEAHGLTLEPGDVQLYLKAILHYTAR